MTLQITFASAHQLWRHVVVLQIHVQVEFASAAQVPHVVIPVKRVILELVSVELLLHVLGKQLDLIATPQTVFASALQPLLHVVVLRIHVQVEFVSAVQMTHVAIQAKHVILEPVSVGLQLPVLDKQPDLIATQQTVFASALQP